MFHIQPLTSLPLAKRRITRTAILPVLPGQASGPSTSAQSAPGGRRSITATLRLPTEDLLAPGDQSISPQHQVYIRGRLTYIWEEARARAAKKPPGALADNHLEMSTEYWVENIVMCQWMAQVEDELKRLKISREASSS
ncbi:uncharacterized protein LOC121991909 [Zingiber officinale]|uniref:uncharacterized protein LOC121991909 n=1 Tax=Zingiber officinale TaxID=94328 RepID=UPI001C4BF0C3|nr:uncharacterized protein LOC121991909 [Zingiber officinale]